MKKWLLPAVLGLSVCCLLGFVSDADSAEKMPKSFLVAFDGAWTEEMGALVRKDGGRILHSLPELSGIVAASEDPEFSQKMKEERWQVQEDPLLPIPSQAALSASVKGNEPEDVDESWSYHWDMQRIMAEGGMSSGENGQAGAQSKLPSRVIALIGTGVNAQSIEIRASLAGGSNLVPADVSPSEKGDVADFRDRIGSGTEEALQLAQAGRNTDKYRVYRIYAENGEARTSWLLNALLEAARDRVSAIHLSPELAKAMQSLQAETGNRTAASVLAERAVALLKTYGIVIEE